MTLETADGLDRQPHNWFRGRLLAGRNCRLRHSVNATNNGLDGVRAVWDMESRRVVIQLRTSNLVFAK